MSATFKAAILSVIIVFALNCGHTIAQHGSPRPPLPAHPTASDYSRIMKQLQQRNPRLHKRLQELKEAGEDEKYNKLMERISKRFAEKKNFMLDPESRKRFKESKEQNKALRQEIRKLRQKYIQAEPEEKARLEATMRSKVTEAFDRTTERRKQMIEQGEKRLKHAQKRLTDAKKELSNRVENRDKHIEAFMERLLTPTPANNTQQPDNKSGAK